MTAWRAPLITAAAVLAICAIAFVIALSALSNDAEDEVSAPPPTTATQPSADSVSTTESPSAPGS